MLPTTTVKRIADELLDQARRSAFGFTDPSGVPVARIYRCDALARLPPGMQQEIVDRATRATNTSAAGILVMLLGPAAFLNLYFAADAMFGQAAPLPVLVGGLLFLPLLLPPLLLSLLTRSAVRRIAARVSAAWPVAAGWQAPAHLGTLAFSATPD